MERWEIEFIQKLQDEAGNKTLISKQIESKWRVVQAGLDGKKYRLILWLRYAAILAIVLVAGVVAFNIVSHTPQAQEKTTVNNSAKEVPIFSPGENRQSASPKIQVIPQILSSKYLQTEQKKDELDSHIVILQTIVNNKEIEDESIPKSTTPLEKEQKKRIKNKRHSKTMYFATQKQSPAPENTMAKENSGFWDMDNHGRHSAVEREDKNKVIKF